MNGAVFMTLITGPVKPVSLPEEDVNLAKDSSTMLADFLNEETQPLTLRIENGQTGHQMQTTVPAGAVRVLAEVLGLMAQGNLVTLIPMEAELSTQQAAELMGVSRPFFIKLLEAGKLPYRKVGEHRRIRYQDLEAFMEAERVARHAALDEMTAEAQQLGLYE
jgi:excisionase family DNA binding protein